MKTLISFALMLLVAPAFATEQNCGPEVEQYISKILMATDVPSSELWDERMEIWKRCTLEVHGPERGRLVWGEGLTDAEMAAYDQDPNQFCPTPEQAKAEFTCVYDAILGK